MSKRITRDGNLYKVFDGERMIYQTTEPVLLRHWMARHEGPYFYNVDEMKL